MLPAPVYPCLVPRKYFIRCVDASSGALSVARRLDGAVFASDALGDMRVRYRSTVTPVTRIPSIRCTVTIAVHGSLRHGVNQRAVQEILGHSDPSLTGNVFTDVPALSLHSEMAKLPWITEEGQRLESVSHLVSQNGEKTPSEPSLPEILQQLRDILQSVRIQAKTNPAPLAEAGSESVEWLPRLGSNQ